MAENGTVGLGYTRKSRVYKRSDESSIERQNNNVTAAIVADGLQPEIYSDADGHRSGKSDRYRPSWRAIMRRLQDPDVRALYVDDLSRAWRSAKGWNDLLEACRRYRVRLRVLRENIDTAAFGAQQKMTSGVFAEIAEFESNIAAERMAGAIAFAKANGVYWGQTPFGYIRVGEGLDARLDIVPADGRAVERAGELIELGLSNRAVARELNLTGYQARDRRTGTPRPFTAEGIRTLARNVLTYAGYVIECGGRAKARRVALDDGPGLAIERYARWIGAKPGQIAPLWSQERASAVVLRLMTPKSSGRPAGAWASLLGPLLWHRGAKLRAQTQGASHFYRHRRRDGLTFDGDAIDAAALARLRSVRFPPAVRAELGRAVASMTDAGQRTALDARAGVLRAQVANLETMLAAGDITRPRFLEMKEARVYELRDIERRLLQPSDADALMSFLDSLGGVLEKLAPAERQRAMRAAFDRIELDDAGDVVGVVLAPWAAQAWAALGVALQAIPIVPPTGVEDESGMRAAVAWLSACVRRGVLQVAGHPAQG